VPVPRRFDRRPPERDTTRINERIRVPEVRLIGDDGNQIGVVKTPEALAYAQERDLDLVEVAAEARPPVCRVLDYSKYKYELEQKQKAARKHQQNITVREIKFRPKIAQHDYDTKKGHVMRFLRDQSKVKVTIMFRGREMAHPERGQMILERLADELQDLAIVEQRPLQDGRNMTMMLGPAKAADKPADEAEAEAEAEAEPVVDAGNGAAATPPAKPDAPVEAEAEAPAAEEAKPEAPAAEEAEEAKAKAPTKAKAKAKAPAKAKAKTKAKAPAAAEAEAPAEKPA
jgi:translation initiation factor IF-3